MSNNLSSADHERTSQALRWLEVLNVFLPNTAVIKVSSGWAIILLLALWIWRDCLRH